MAPNTQSNTAAEFARNASAPVDAEPTLDLAAEPLPDMENLMPSANTRESTPSSEPALLNARDLAIVKAIADSMLASRGPSIRKDKLEPPEPFDGRNKNKLGEFIASLEMYFHHNYEMYDGRDEQKVIFAGSRLSGHPKSWYMNFHRDDIPNPPFFYDYPAFLRELRDRFGIRDEQEHAENRIRELRMTDDQRFDNFIMNFELFKERIPDWSDRNFYNMLLQAVAPRI